MLNKLRKSKDQTYHLPISGYIAYFLTKFLQLFTPFTYFYEKFETMVLFKEIRKLKINKPIYITGLARSGTTIILEMLSKHPNLASHQYKNLLIPYCPYWFYKITIKLRIFSKPVERVHMDGIMITKDSPEAVEEIFWRKYFKHSHNEKYSHIINENTQNPKFEKFYSNHIRKLLIAQERPQYLAKNNYNITRMEYLLKIFPSAKFLLIVRNPVDQIASLIKQTKLFMNIERDIPFFHDWLNILGHQEFGYQRICINVNDPDGIYKIRKLWSKQKSYVKGWAFYWASIYDFIINQLEENDKLRKATLIVKYDELCETPAKVINLILNHTELPSENYMNVKEYYIKNFHKPTYYTPDFSKQELKDIIEITNKTASRLGINLEKFL